MKTLILYATKHGAASEVAQRIAKLIDGAVLRDLKRDGIYDKAILAKFDCIIIGSSVYAGMIRKEAKTFIGRTSDALQKKKLGLFLCGMDASQEQAFFKANFPAEILQAAKAASFMGGIFDPKKAGVMGRIIVKAAAKQSEYTDSIDDEKIKQFAEVMRG